MTSFREYLGAKRRQAGFVFHVALVSLPITTRAASPINADFLPSRCASATIELPATFDKKVMWPILADLDAMERATVQKGRTPEQQACFENLKTQVGAWLAARKERPSAEQWAFRAGFLFHTEANKSAALAAAQEAIRYAKNPAAVAEYYRSLSLRYSQVRDINDALGRASISSDAEPFDVTVRRRAMMLLRGRLSGRPLLDLSERWSKLYPTEVDVQLVHFHAALDAGEYKDANATLEKLKAMDLGATDTSEPALRAEILIAEGKYNDASLIYKSLLSEASVAPKKRLQYQRLYLRSLVGLGAWREVRTLLSELLPAEPSDAELLAHFDEAIDKGGVDPLNPLEDLEAALRLSPESTLIKYALAKVYIKQFEDGPRLDKANLINRAETLAAQLAFAEPGSVDVGYLNAKVYYLKKVYSKAEFAIVPAINDSKRSGAKFKTTISDLYEVGARIAWSRGDWGEAKRLAREGISRINLRAAKAPLQELLKQIP
ncbi:MAG TPA: hypothetical protein VM901_12120 [Bdellovibrionota bacterium]|nr:hypothetical protein [Bdellovibrionota bacterium]